VQSEKTARLYATGERRDLAVLQPVAPRESSVPEPQLSGIVRGEDLTLIAADQASSCYEGHAAEWHRGAQCLVWIDPNGGERDNAPSVNRWWMLFGLCGVVPTWHRSRLGIVTLADL
jgi:hypothetical protein